MSTESWDKLKTRLCTRLRAKEMFYDSGKPAEERFGSGIFWCTHTCHCLGPDGKPVSHEACGPDRGCYEQ